MADDARISTAFPNHHKTKKLEKRLGATGAWALVKLFLWVADNRYDGDLSGQTAEDIEICVDWKGDDGQFVTALSEVGFLDGEAGSYRVHDWAMWNPFAASRAERVERARQNASKRHKHGKQVASQPQATIEPDDSQVSAHLTTPHLTTHKTKPSARDASDDRFSRVKEFIKKCCEFKQVPFLWEASEGKQLKSFLQAAGKDMNIEAICGLVRNRFNSREPPGDRPRIWLSNLGRYATENGNGRKQQTYADKNQQSVIDAVNASIAADSGLDQERNRDAGDSLRTPDDERTIDVIRGRPSRLQGIPTASSVQSAKAGT